MPGTHLLQYFGWGTSIGISPPTLLRTFGCSRPILVVLAQWQHLMMSFIHWFARKSKICDATESTSRRELTIKQNFKFSTSEFTKIRHFEITKHPSPLIACPHCSRRFRRQFVTENGNCCRIRRQSPVLATVAEWLFGDYSRRCGQGFRRFLPELWTWRWRHCTVDQ